MALINFNLFSGYRFRIDRFRILLNIGRLLPVLTLWSASAMAQSSDSTPSEISFQGLISPREMIHPSDFLIENWTVRDGLPRSGVTAIAQTPDGFLWLGLERGLARFNGSEFKRYLPTAHPGLVKRPIKTLFVDRTGRLWIGSKGDGVSVMERGEFRKMDLSNPIFGDEVHQFAQDNHGVIWRASSKGIHYYQNETAQPVAQEKSALVGAISYRVVEDSYSKRIYGCYWETAGFWEQDEFIQVLEEKSGMPVPSNNFFPRKEGGIWFLSSDGNRYGALHRLLPNGKLTAPQSWPFEIPQYGIGAFLEASDGGLWVSVTNDAVYRVGLDGVYERFEIGKGVITALFEDREGSVWAGSSVAGLYRIKKRLFHAYPEAGTTSAHMLYDDHQGGVIFTQGNAVYQISDAGELNAIGVESHFGALMDHEGTIWSGIEGGLAQWIHNGSRFEAVDLDRRNLFYGCQSLFLDQSGALWFGGIAGGIARRVDGKTEIIDLDTGTVTAFADGLEGSVWLGYNTGNILQCDGSKFTEVPGLTGQIHDIISSILPEENQSLWITTMGGGFYHWVNGVLTQFTTSNGMPSDEIGGAVILNNALWLTTTQGVVTVSLADLQAIEEGQANTFNCIVYGVEDGLPNLECSTEFFPAIHLSPQGTLWIGTSEGITSVHTQEMPEKRSNPPVFIEQIMIDDAQVNPGADPVIVPPGSVRLTFQYTGINLNTSRVGRFQYRLVGQEPDWVDAWSSTEAHYTRLAPGEYQFVVRASDHQGGWSQTPATIHLRMLPYFWQTPEFKVATALGAAIGIALIAWLTTRGAYLGRIQKLIQERAVEQERSRIAEDLHDRLGSQSTQMIFLTKALDDRVSSQDWQELREYSERIKSTAKDMTVSLDEIVWTTDPAKDNVESSLAFFLSYAESYFKNTPISLRIDIPIHIESREISMEVRHEVFLAIREALTNVLKHAQASEVWLRVQIQDSRLRIQVDDNGIGMETQTEHKGRSGLKNIQRRIESLAGTVEFKSSQRGGLSVQIEVPIDASKPSRSH